jgi:hypothetical protein
MAQTLCWAMRASKKTKQNKAKIKTECKKKFVLVSNIIGRYRDHLSCILGLGRYMVSWMYGHCCQELVASYLGLSRGRFGEFTKTGA